MKVNESMNQLRETTRWTPERLAREQARTLWPQVLRENRGRINEEPGIRVRKRNWADQLCYYDSGGILRGVLVLFREPENPGKQMEYEWHEYTAAGQCLVIADPEHHRGGIGMTLLEEACIRRKWPIDFEKQAYSPAGRDLVNEFLRRWPQFSRKTKWLRSGWALTRFAVSCSSIPELHV